MEGACACGEPLPPRIPGLQGHPRKRCLTCGPPGKGTAYEGHTLRSLRALVREHNRERWPQGMEVLGPFRLHGDGYLTGRGVVDWYGLSSACSWRAIPVLVIAGDRLSGGYLPDELRPMPNLDRANLDPSFQNGNLETAA